MISKSKSSSFLTSYSHVFAFTLEDESPKSGWSVSLVGSYIKYILYVYIHTHV